MWTRHECWRQSWPEAIDAALALGDLQSAEELLSVLAERPVGHVPPYLRAQLARFRARLSAAHGEHESVERDFTSAAQLLEKLGYPFALACVRADHAAWLVGQDRGNEARPWFEAAAATFRTLGAAPALRRISGLLPMAPVQLPGEVPV